MHEIVDVVNSAVGCDAKIDIEVCSLASDPFRPAEKIATLESPNIPDEIYAKAAKDGWTLETYSRNSGGGLGRRNHMIMDTHFHGFTPLHSCEDADCTSE